MTTRTKYAWLVFIGGWVMCGVAVEFVRKEWHRPTLELWSKIKVGDTETKVRSTLGKPQHEYDRAGAPSDYYVSGYGRKERPITHRVLIYFGGVDLVLYVWIGTDGCVEELAHFNS